MPTSDSMWAPHNADKRDTWFGAKRAESMTTTNQAKPSTTHNTKPEDAPKPPMTSGAYQSMWAPHNADKRADWLDQRHPSVVEGPSPTSVRKGSQNRSVRGAGYLCAGKSIVAHEKPLDTKTLPRGSSLDKSEDAPNLAKGLTIRGANAGEKVVEESGEPRTPRRAKKIKRHTASESAPCGRWDHEQFKSM